MPIIGKINDPTNEIKAIKFGINKQIIKHIVTRTTLIKYLVQYIFLGE